MDKAIGSVDHVRRVLDDLCCHDLEINTTHHKAVAALLRTLAVEFGMLGTRYTNQPPGAPPLPTTRDPAVVAKGLCEFLVRLTKPESIKTVAIIEHDGERGITGLRDDGTQQRTARTAMKGLLSAALDAQIIKEAEARGWVVA